MLLETPGVLIQNYGASGLHHFATQLSEQRPGLQKKVPLSQPCSLATAPLPQPKPKR